jgi:hypothetical protein
MKSIVKDRRGDQRGGEWEPIKIPQKNLAYIPKSTQSHNKRNPAALKPSLAVEKAEAKTENNQRRTGDVCKEPDLNTSGMRNQSRNPRFAFGKNRCEPRQPRAARFPRSIARRAFGQALARVPRGNGWRACNVGRKALSKSKNRGEATGPPGALREKSMGNENREEI